MEARREMRATMESFQVQRDGEGKIIPEEFETEFGWVDVIPMTYGDIEEWSKLAKRKGGIQAEHVTRQLKRHVATPDMSDLTAEMLQNDFKATAVAELLKAIMAVSGIKGDVEVDDEGNAIISIDEEEND